MSHKSFVFGLTFGLCLSLSSAQAAQDPVGTTALTDEQVTERLGVLDRQFESQQSDAELWEYGWGAFNGGSFILSTAEAVHTDNRKDRDMNIVQSVESLVGVADIIFRPLPSFDASSVCSQKVTTEEDRVQCLAAKESLAQSSAERANEPYEIQPHVETLGINVLAGGIIWALAGSNRALITAVPGEIIGEMQLWSTPGQPARDYKSYSVQFSPMAQMSTREKNMRLGVDARWSF